MFTRFTEEARRVVFFARYEASRFGSREITTEQLLLGCLREDERLKAGRFVSPAASVSIRDQIELQCPKSEKISTSVDLPLSHPAKRVLAYGAEESGRMQHQHIGVGHLFLGLLREEKTLAADLLQQHGLTLATLREKLSQPAPAPVVSLDPQREPEASDLCRDLTRAAASNTFPPLIARASELANIIAILGRRSGNNPVLVGEPGVGKTAIVEGLAQRIVDEQVPAFLRASRILALNPLNYVDSPKARREFQNKFAALISETAGESGVILFIDGLFDPAVRTASPFADVLGPLLGALAFRQSIATGTPAGYREAVRRDPVIERYFRAVDIAPPAENDAIQILVAVKEQYEQFHGVVYDEGAVECAVFASVRFMPSRHLPEKAIDLLDEAGSRVKLRAEPDEIVKCLNRLRAAAKQEEAALANHAFEKAGAFAENVRQEREKLNLLREKYKIDAPFPKPVKRQDVEELVAERTGLSVETIRQRLAPK